MIIYLMIGIFVAGLAGLASPNASAGLVAAFAFGTFWFWTLAALYLIALLDVIDQVDDGVSLTLGVLSLIIFGGFLQLYSDIKPLNIVQSIQNPHGPRWPFVVIGVIYVAAGCSWSLFKWWQTESRKCAEAKQRFLERRLRDASDLQNALLKMDAGLAEDWAREAQRLRSSPDSRKSVIVGWIAFWPISVLKYLVADFLRNVGDFVYQRLRKTYIGISDRVWQG